MILELIKKYEILSYIYVVLFTFAFAFIGEKIIRVIISSFFVKLVKNNNKILALKNIILSLSKYAIYSLAIIYIIFKIFGTVPVTLASIGAAVVGFGTQSIIKDILSGIFMNIEDQFNIGDLVTIGSSTGVVESIEIRVVKLRAINGDLIIIPNGSIIYITNHSKGHRRFEVFFQIDYKEDNNKVNEILSQIIEKNTGLEGIIEGPVNMGITELTDIGIKYRITGLCVPQKRIEIESNLRSEIVKMFKTKGIKFAYINNIKKQ